MSPERSSRNCWSLCSTIGNPPFQSAFGSRTVTYQSEIRPLPISHMLYFPSRYMATANTTRMFSSGTALAGAATPRLCFSSYCLNFKHESSLPPLYWRHVLLTCAAWRMLAAQWQLITVDSIRFVNSLFFTLQQQHQLDGRTELYRMLCMCVDSSTRSIAARAVFLI